MGHLYRVDIQDSGSTLQLKVHCPHARSRYGTSVEALLRLVSLKGGSQEQRRSRTAPCSSCTLSAIPMFIRNALLAPITPGESGCPACDDITSDTMASTTVCSGLTDLRLESPLFCSHDTPKWVAIPFAASASVGVGEGLGFWVWAWGFRFRVWGFRVLGLMISGLGHSTAPDEV